MQTIKAFLKAIYSNEIIEVIGKIILAGCVFDFISNERPSEFTGVVLTIFTLTVFGYLNTSIKTALDRLDGIEKSNKNVRSYHDAA